MSGSCADSDETGRFTYTWCLGLNSGQLGAPWIWKRVPLLVQALGLAVEQVHELLDFYHAVQHLGQVAALRKDWNAKARARWRTQQRRLLLQGQVEQVIAAVGDICRGRNSKAIRKHRDYFIKNQTSMAYAKLMVMKRIFSINWGRPCICQPTD